MPVSYMGTKRHLAPTVRSAIEALDPQGPVLDLFGGMGSVAEALAPRFPVLCNDFLGFASAISAARLVPAPPRPGALLATIEPIFRGHRTTLQAHFGRRLAEEALAISSGQEELQRWMERAPSVATSAHYTKRARQAASATGVLHYELATLYFSAGYFSTHQSIDLDSLRCAIDQAYPKASPSRTVAIAAFLVAASRLSNSPGHTAQFLRPNSPEAFNRIRATYARSTWRAFAQAIHEHIAPLGTLAWRSESHAISHDANDLLRTTKRRLGAIYADPPYSRDQYARFYHVQETLYRYDYPGAAGRGRGPRKPRPTSGFSRVSQVESSFKDMFRNVARLRAPLVLSYPSEGLLHARSVCPVTLAKEWLDLTGELVLPHIHSTLGASHGTARNDVFEHIYTFMPKPKA